MKLGRWSLATKEAGGRTNLVLGCASEWTVALQFRFHRSLWFTPPLTTFPDRIGRETRLTGLHLLWWLEFSLASTTHRKMDIGRRLSWRAWIKRESRKNG
jgi:hypothetical protein